MKNIILFLTFALMARYSFGMMKALNIAATGMATQEMHVNTISNNVANLNTVAYKKQRAESQELMYETITEAGSRSDANSNYTIGVQVGSGSKISGVRKVFSAGAPKITNNPFDLMINGDGFFGIIKPNGQVVYTRDGAFNVNAQGQLVTKQGYQVFPGIAFPPGVASVSIGNDGMVDAYFTGQVEPQNVGQIPVFTFINNPGLHSDGGNFYRTTTASGQAIQGIAGVNNAGAMQQGALEMANVSLMNEMTDLIKAQRAYEMNSKVMGVADQMLQTVNNITR